MVEARDEFYTIKTKTTSYTFYPNTGVVVVNEKYSKRYALLPCGTLIIFNIKYGELRNTVVSEPTEEINRLLMARIFEKQMLGEA